MQSQIKIAFLFLLVSALTGCLENLGGKEVTQIGAGNSTDFIVQPPPSDGGQEAQGPNDQTPTTPEDDPGVPQIIRGLYINNDAQVTGSRTLEIRYEPPFSSGYLKLSEDAFCGSGEWRDFVETESVTVQSADAVVTLSAQFRDFDGRTSRCYSRSIKIDDAGPEIIFSQYPASSVEEGSTVEIVYSVTDLLSDVKSVTCEFAGVQKPCLAGTATVQFPSMIAGDYVFKISAEDIFGNRSSKSIGFKVTSLYKQMAQEVKVNQYNKVDILFVMDNSGSMAYEQRSMANRVRNFIDVIRGLDWQIGITTTDPRNTTLGDGRLVPMKSLSSTYLLNSSMEENLVRDVLSSTLQRTETGSGSEQGIYTTYRALERSVANDGNNSGLIREGAQLAVVLISDEDESANGAKNDPSNLINYIQQTFQGSKALSFHSIITRPDDTACKSTYGATYGFRYQSISNLTGGVIGDVCALDYAAQVQGIAEGVRKTLKTFSLACEPVQDGVRKIEITKDGAPFTEAFTVAGVNVSFTDMLPEGNYDVKYTCLR